MIKLVAFDWNGTLLADTRMNLEVSNINFKKYGLKPIKLSEFRQTFDIPISKFWISHGGKIKDISNQAINFHQIYETKVDKCRLRVGSRDLLEWLENVRIKQMIYSNHIAPDIIKQLMRLNIFEYFDEILARSAGEHTQVHFRRAIIPKIA